MVEFSLCVVVPVRNDSQYLKSVLTKINCQSLAPKSIIIIDSSTDDAVHELIKYFEGDVSIIYHRMNKAYPGKARNIGVKLASSDWIAFLDSKTLPEDDWLERYHHLIEAYHADAIFGVTMFNAKTYFQKILRSATYGNVGHITVPGTLVKRQVFIDSGGFMEHVRMGEDIEWRERLVNKGLKIYTPDYSIVSYNGLPDNFLSTLKKYVNSAYHTARLNILRNVKDAYLTLLLILSAIILPKWNHLISGWDTSPFFIPHVTKIYLIALIFLFLAYQLIHHLFFRDVSHTLFSQILQLIILIFVTLAVFNWNAVIAGWMENAVLYVPHITKMYVGGIILASILYRGIFLPAKRKVEPGFLFPFRWLQVGLLGLCLDLIKAPGYVVGAVVETIPTRRILRTPRPFKPKGLE